jgi:hypothetical protein
MEWEGHDPSCAEAAPMVADEGGAEPLRDATHGGGHRYKPQDIDLTRSRRKSAPEDQSQFRPVGLARSSPTFPQDFPQPLAPFAEPRETRPIHHAPRSWLCGWVLLAPTRTASPTRRPSGTRGSPRMNSPATKDPRIQPRSIKFDPSTRRDLPRPIGAAPTVAHENPRLRGAIAHFARKCAWRKLPDFNAGASTRCHHVCLRL